MKRIAVSLGLVAVGAPVVMAGPSDMLSPMEASKPWTVSASLRGFYDSNYTLAHSNRRDSYGFELSPQLGLNLPLEQTLITASYIYTYQWYQDRDHLGLDPADQSHQFSLDVTHAFSQSFNANIHDDIVVSQEPQLLEPTGAFPGRANGNNIRNTGSTTLDFDVTPLVGITAGYQNNFVSYDEHGGTAANPSLSGLLDRDEDLAHVDLRFRVTPSTTAFVGYQFGAGCYTGNEPIAAAIILTPLPVLRVYNSTSRNYYSHYGYVGVRHAFTETFNANAQAGIRYTDYYNDPSGKTATSPYAEASLSDSYMPGATATFGFRHDRNPTDVVAPDSNGNITVDQESSTVFLDIVQPLSTALTVHGTANFQAATFDGGTADGKTDYTYGLGLDFSYAFTEHFSADLSYYFDSLASDLPVRSYTRNRVYLGVTATF